MDLFPIEKDVEGKILRLWTDLSHDLLADGVDVRDGKQGDRFVDVWQVVILDDVLQSLHELHVLHSYNYVVHGGQVQHDDESSQLRHPGYLVTVLLSQDFQKALHASVSHKDVPEVRRVRNVRQQDRDLFRNVDVVMRQKIKQPCDSVHLGNLPQLLVVKIGVIAQILLPWLFAINHACVLDLFELVLLLGHFLLEDGFGVRLISCGVFILLVCIILVDDASCGLERCGNLLLVVLYSFDLFPRVVSQKNFQELFIARQVCKNDGDSECELLRSIFVLVLPHSISSVYIL